MLAGVEEGCALSSRAAAGAAHLHHWEGLLNHLVFGAVAVLLEDVQLVACVRWVALGVGQRASSAATYRALQNPTASLPLLLLLLLKLHNLLLVHMLILSSNTLCVVLLPRAVPCHLHLLH